MACWQGNKWARVSSDLALVVTVFSSLERERDGMSLAPEAFLHGSSIYSAQGFFTQISIV